MGKNNGETKCPIKSCGVWRTDLPRHMQKIHKWADSETKHVKSFYNLRKKYTFKTQHPAKKVKIITIIKAVELLQRHWQDTYSEFII